IDGEGFTRTASTQQRERLRVSVLPEDGALRTEGGGRPADDLRRDIVIERMGRAGFAAERREAQRYCRALRQEKGVTGPAGDACRAYDVAPLVGGGGRAVLTDLHTQVGHRWRGGGSETKRMIVSCGGLRGADDRPEDADAIGETVGAAQRAEIGK